MESIIELDCETYKKGQKQPARHTYAELNKTVFH